MAALGAIELAGIIASNAQTLWGGLSGYATQAWMLSTQRSEIARANIQLPNVTPGAQEILEAYYKGGMTYSELVQALKWSGIAIDVNDFPFLPSIMWQKMVDIRRPRPPLDVLLRADALGYTLLESLDKSVTRMGYRYTSDRELLINDSNTLDFPLLWQMRARDLITDDDVIKFLKHAGWRDETIQKLVLQMSGAVDHVTALTLLNRGVLTSDDLTKYQKWEGYRDDDVRKHLKEMRWQWPNIGQLTQWGQAQAFDGNRASSLQLDTEQPDNYYEYAKAAGQHWVPGADQPDHWPDPNVSPALLAWRAHWRTNDLASAITMLHRLRPTGGPNGGPRVPGVTPYTNDDFAADLKAIGIAPGRRDQLKAITYSMPRFTVYRTALASGIIPKSEITERLQDTGYSADTAKLLADVWEHQDNQRHVNELRPIARAQVVEAYRLGTLSRQAAARGLYIIFLSDYLQILDFLKQPLESQYSAALGNGFVSMALTSIDAEIAGELAKQAIQVIRKAYLRLEIDGTQAASQLYALGIVPQRAGQYIQLWTAEHAASGLESTAGQLRDWYINHLIDQPTYTTRLSLLGYGAGDIAMMVARANLDISERAARLQAQTVKAQQLQAKQLMAAAKASAATQKAIQKQICSSGTRLQVATWATKGLLSYPDALKRLTECGMTQDDALRLLTQKQPKKGALTYEQVSEKALGQPTPSGS